MRLLVKIGGTLLDAEDSRRRLAREIATAGAGHELVVVHGGGKQMTRYLAEHGLESRFVEGLRVTTPEVIDAVLKIFAGSVNKMLVAAFVEAGVRAVGLSGVDAALVEAEQMRPELGQVGRPVRANTALLELLCSSGYLPVVACVAGDRQGRIYNVNADQMAVACASGFKADRLIFLTDVDGVLDGEKRVIPVLTLSQSKALISNGVASGGMQAKLTAAAGALENGVSQVVIAPGSCPQVVARLLAGEAIGTRIVSGEVQNA